MFRRRGDAVLGLRADEGDARITKGWEPLLDQSARGSIPGERNESDLAPRVVSS